MAVPCLVNAMNAHGTAMGLCHGTAMALLPWHCHDERAVAVPMAAPHGSFRESYHEKVAMKQS